MTPEPYQLLNALADSAIQLPTERRAGFLHTACGADAKLREEVERLITAESDGGDFLRQPLLEALAGDLLGRPAQRIWPAAASAIYEVVSHLGNSCDRLLMRTETSNMKPNEPSRTALMIARQRAAHQVLDHGSILDDPFAMKILREDEKDVLQFANKLPLASIGRLYTAARSRIAEDALSRAVERGVRQIVILGAGLDTFALRNPHRAPQIRIYEVDHPATQAWKRQRLAEAEIALPPWLILVPVDFEQDDVAEKLAAAGFQQNSPAFFTWLGVVPYLTQDAIGRTLDYMSSIQNSEVVFDYMEPPQAFSEELRQLETARTEQLKKIEERSISRFEPAGITAILRSHGFCSIEDIDFQEIASRFGLAVQGLAPGHAGIHVVHAKH